MGQGPTLVHPKQTDPLRSPPGPPALPPLAPPVPRRQARRVEPPAGTQSAQAHVQSRNWAGAVVPANRGERFSRIEGTWTVPRIGHRDVSKGLVSIWVGLGGSRPSSNSMPQIGTEHGWDGSMWVSRLWCQWWRGANSVEGFMSRWVPGVSLSPGDVVTCGLEVMDNDDPRVKDGKVVFQWRLGGVVREYVWTEPRAVMADTANWIVERPTQVYLPARETETSFQPGVRLGRHHPLPGVVDANEGAIPTGEEVAFLRGCKATLGPVAGAVPSAVRRPSDGQLVSLRSIIPGAGRSFVELEPSVAINPRDDELRIVRHLP